MTTILVPEKHEVTEAVQINNRAKVAIMKQRLCDADVLSQALEATQTGRMRTVGPKGGISYLAVSVAERIDLLKCMINKILPNAKIEGELSEHKDSGKWAELLAKEQEIITREDALKSKREARGPIAEPGGRRPKS